MRPSHAVTACGPWEPSIQVEFEKEVLFRFYHQTSEDELERRE